MLRRHAELVGLQRNFTILDTDDQLRLIKQLILAADLDEKRWPARQLAGLIDGWKNRGLDARRDRRRRVRALCQRPRRRALCIVYQERLKALNACDFGDLLLHMLRIFDARTATCSRAISERFRYILVDEYQDTNAVQYLWLRLLARSARTSAASATTTSRSIPGAARWSTTS